MKIRSSVAALALVALVATGAGCSNSEDSKKSSDKDNSEQGTAKKGSRDSSESPTSTVDDDEFTSTMTKIRTDIESAGTDKCALVDAVQTTPPSPANDAQSKEFVMTYVALLNGLSKVMGPDSTDGKALADAAKQFDKVAKEKGYSVDLLQSDEIAVIMTGEAMTLALTEFGKMSATCNTGTSGGADTPIVTESVPASGD